MIERWMCTAAHCTQRQYAHPNSFFVASGAHTRLDGTRYNVTRVVNHPRFNAFTLAFDVSVVQIADQFRFGPAVRPIHFPTSPTIPTNDTATFASWGPSRVSQPICFVNVEITHIYGAKKQNNCRDIECPNFGSFSFLNVFWMFIVVSESPFGTFLR